MKYRVELPAPGTLPRTSSGKLRRGAGKSQLAEAGAIAWAQLACMRWNAGRKVGRAQEQSSIARRYVGSTRLQMIKKLTKHGNSLALVIDRPILDLLKIDTDTPLEISTDGKRLIVASAETSERKKKFNAAQGSAHKHYGKAFKKLAE